MNRITLISIITLLSITFMSCSDDGPMPLQWEIADYDTEEISVGLSPAYYIQGQIIAKAEYSGELIMLCTNYSEVIPETNAGDVFTAAELGLTIERIAPASIRIKFDPITELSAGEATITVGFTGKRKGESNIAMFNIGRRN